MSRRQTQKVIALLLCICFVAAIMAGCSGSKKGNEVTTAGVASAAATTSSVKNTNPSVLEITRANYFGDSSDLPELKEQLMKDFEAKFKIKLKVNALPANGYTDKLNIMVSSGEISGIVNLQLPADVLRYKDDGVIVALDDHLKDNATWKTMDPNYKALYKYDNATWGLGMAYAGNIFVRSFRKDWLDKLNLKTPQTVEDLAVVAKAFTENDPDGNGKNDTYGLTGAGAGWNLQDIFQAFDARLDNTGGSTIVWDPNVNSWIDSMLKPEMVDALKYTRDLYTKKYIDPEMFTNKSSVMREKITTGKAGSVFYWLQWAKTNEPTMQKTDPKASIVEVPVITGKRTKNLNQMVMTGTPYVLLKNTKQPKEVINAFIDKFIGDKDGYMLGRFGIEGKNYRKDNNEVVQLINPTTKAIMQGPALFGEFPQYDLTKISVVTDGTKESMDASRILNNDRMKVINDGIAKGVVFPCPYDTCISATRTKISADADKIFQEAFVKAITGEVQVEEAIKTYRAKMKALGADAILQEANKANGLKNTMTY